MGTIFYFDHDFGGMLSVNSPMGRSMVTADHKFTFCNGFSQRYCVVDGDTIRFAGTKIRVEDIDTPEIHDYKCEQELKRGLHAKSRLLELVMRGHSTLYPMAATIRTGMAANFATSCEMGFHWGNHLLMKAWPGAMRAAAAHGVHRIHTVIREGV